MHQTIHELHRKKKDGVLFKIVFEKAYDMAILTTNLACERFGS